MYYGHDYKFEYLDKLEKAMNDYLNFYKSKRIIAKLKRLTPIKYIGINH